MIEIAKNFPQMFSEEPVEVKLNLTGNYNKIIYCGMGGSGIAGKIARDAFNLPIQIVQDYELPKTDDQTLVLIVTYSGNTEETLACMGQAKNCVVISSGGKALEQAQNYIKVKSGVPARAAFPYMLKALCVVLEKTGFIQMPKIEFESFETVDAKAKEYSEKLFEKIPIIYTSKYLAVARRIKQDFNEFSKIPSYVQIFPELVHNETVGWGSDFRKNFIIIILRHGNEDLRVSKHINIIKELLKDKVEILEHKMKGTKKIEMFFNTNWLFTLCSIYLAQKYGFDPKENLIIDKLKSKLTGE